MSTSKLLTTSEVADHFRVSSTTVLNWIKRGAIPGTIALDTGGNRPTYRIPESSLSLIVRSANRKKTPEIVEEII